ncbi:MAG: phosphopantothenate/pantothenate synthetase [Methanomassiliicoccales archaeon]|nr:MAG: phosphopantothenate/pantothenate synthetase [Methanomassiliicoccales archaeon]
MHVPKSHPRYESLKKREKIIDGMKAGIVAEAGLIAHGRGEAFDYLIGERTIPEAELAEKIAAYHLIMAKHPVISVNGNTAVLVPDELVKLSELLPANLEINLFYRSEKRVRIIAELLIKHGAKKVLGEKPDATIPGLEHKRGVCSEEGTMRADVILIPLEDGDRAMALKKMGKTVIAIDLNPLSRTSKAANITIVDDVVRAMPRIIEDIKRAREKGLGKEVMKGDIEAFDNSKNLICTLKRIKNGDLSLY